MEPTAGGDDRRRMAEALDLARRGRGSTSPNPLVGAIVVRDGVVVGSGFHERFGGPHAELGALEQSGDRARGATMYVTLEPCCTWGKTPPCTDAIIDAGVARVVTPILDPNPSVNGRGVDALRRAGIDVDVGVLSSQAEALNAPYLKFRRTGYPFVRLKLAVSLDGRVGAPHGPRWISCEESRELVHAMRAEADCVMVGIGTVLEDDPLLTDRRPGDGRRQPSRLVVDSRLRLSPDAALVADAASIPTAVACGPAADPSRASELEGRAVAVWRCPEGPAGLDLAAVLREAAGRGLLDLLCEGGPRLATSLLRERLVDAVAVFVAPSFIGSDGVAALGPLSGLTEGASALSNVRWRTVGRDLLVEADVGDAAGGARREEESCSRG